MAWDVYGRRGCALHSWKTDLSWKNSMRYLIQVTICLCFSGGMLNADVCSHNYVTNRLEYRNVASNKLDLAKFKNLEAEKIVFNDREFIFKRQNTRYLLRCTAFNTILTYYPSDLICVYIPEEADPILILKEYFSFWMDKSEKTLKIITLDSYVPQSTLPFNEIVNFVNHLRACLSKQWHFLHLSNDPVDLTSPSIQLQTRTQNILAGGLSTAEKLGAKSIKWAENLHREILPSLLYEEGKKWIQTQPTLGQIRQGLETLENSSVREEYKALIDMFQAYGCSDSSSLKEVYTKVNGTPSENHFLASFCNYNHRLINDLVLQSCQKGLNYENAFDRLLAIHILEEFARIYEQLEKNNSLIRFSQETRLSSKAKPAQFSFYLEKLEHGKEDVLGFKFHRCPSNPSIFLLTSFADAYTRLRPEIFKLTRQQIDQVYEDQCASVEVGINDTLPLEKRVQQLAGEVGIGKLVNNQVLHLFSQRDGEAIVLMADQALNCLRDSEGKLSDRINKDEIWKSYFEEQKSWKNYLFSSSESSYTPLLTWYLVIGLINGYDNFFVQLPTGWFEQAKETFFDTYYTREEDGSGKDIRKKW